MRILLIIFFMSAVCLTSIDQSYAAKIPKLETVYGEDLTKVPQLIRVKFQNDTGRSWDDTTREERAEFLAQWQQQRLEEQAADKNRAKQIQDQKKTAAAHERARQLKKQAKERALAEKQKIKDAEKKAEDEERQALVKQRKEALSDLKKAQTERNKH